VNISKNRSRLLSKTSRKPAGPSKLVPDYSFSVAFPANPQVDTTTYQVVDGHSVPAHVYSVRHRPCDQGAFHRRRGEVRHPAPHLQGLRSSAQRAGGGWQPLDGRSVRLQWPALPDRGQSASWRGRHRGRHPVRTGRAVYTRKSTEHILDLAFTCPVRQKPPTGLGLKGFFNLLSQSSTYEPSRS